MNRLPRLAAAAALFLALAPLSWAQSGRAAPDKRVLEGILDAGVSLKTLDQLISAGKEASIPAGRFFLLTGRMGKLMDRTPEAEGSAFEGESELSGGEWIGLEAVKAYKAFLSFHGDAFYPMADSESDAYVKPGTMVMVIGWYVGKKPAYGERVRKDLAIIEVERVIPIE